MGRDGYAGAAPAERTDALLPRHGGGFSVVLLELRGLQASDALRAAAAAAAVPG